MLGRLGLKLFSVGLFAFIILFHFFSTVWMIKWVPLLCWALMGVGFILWFVFSIEWIIGWIQKRSSQFGISVLISSVGIIGLLAVLNWGAIQGQSLYPKYLKHDFTRNNIHSLSDQSIKILKSLQEDVTLEVWSFNLKEMSGVHDMPRMLDNYVQNSNGHIKLVVKNPNSERLEAIQAKITRKDVIIAKAASGRESRIDSFNDAKAEEQITNAIVKAIKGRKKMICFLSGHGELEASAGTNPGQSISDFKESLENSSYSVREITLLTEKVVPSECETIASVGPRSSPSDTEVKLLTEYLAKGGKLLAMWGFETPTSWQQIIAPFGVKIDNNILIDERVQGAPAVYTKNFAADSDFARSFSQPLLFVLTRSINVPPAPPAGVSVKAVVSVEDGTLLKEGDVKSLKGGVVSRATLASANSKAVVVEIKKAIAAEEAKKDEEKVPAKEMGIILMGSNMVASNGLIGQFGNMDFLMNSVSYLMEDKDLIGIRPREVKSAKLELTGSRLREVQGYLLLSTLAFIALAFATAFGRKTTLS
ncbi:MAG: GldG family protein [Bdellovibrionota bacterium]